MTHRIRRQILDLELPREEDAEELQRRAARLFRDKVAPALERQFDALSEDGVYLRIDRLELDLGALPEDNWEQAYVEEVLKQITVQINDLSYRAGEVRADTAFDAAGRAPGSYWGQFGSPATENKSGSFRLQNLPLQARNEHIFLTFLNSGILPWYAGTERLEMLETIMREQIPGIAEPLRALFRRQPAAVKRLAYQFSPSFVYTLLDAVLGVPSGWMATFTDVMVRFQATGQSTDSTAGQKVTGTYESIIPPLSRRTLAAILERMVPAALNASMPAPSANTPAALVEWLFLAEPELFKNLLPDALSSSPKPGREVNALPAAAPHSSVPGSMAEESPASVTKTPASETTKQVAGDPAAPHSSIPGSMAEESPASITKKSEIPAPETTKRAAGDPERASTFAPKKTPLPDEDFIMVENAGLVLLAPYIAPFFKNLGLTEAGNFTGTETQQRAVHLLHFLATGAEHPDEPQLTLCKLLCAWPWEEPIEQDIDLADAEKEEAIRLLQAVIANWEVLKNESINSLQVNFLQRAGQIFRPADDRSWRLRPERQSYDILLDRLPWSISIVRLPWMQEMIQVEW